jgi:hypothetical protein
VRAGDGNRSRSRPSVMIRIAVEPFPVKDQDTRAERQKHDCDPRSNAKTRRNRRGTIVPASDNDVTKRTTISSSIMLPLNFNSHHTARAVSVEVPGPILVEHHSPNSPQQPDRSRDLDPARQTTIPEGVSISPDTDGNDDAQSEQGRQNRHYGAGGCNRGLRRFCALSTDRGEKQ